MRFEPDLTTLRQMTSELSDYLLADVLFWPLGGSAHFPKLSLGSYLLTRARLAADPQGRAEPLNQQADRVLARWAATAERKAALELPVRVRLWQNYLEERQGRYATEVAQRAIVALLLQRFPVLGETPEARLVAGLDAALRGHSTAGEFVWEAAVQPAFPEDAFWFLYRQV
jgi:hypothetical protein